MMVKNFTRIVLIATSLLFLNTANAQSDTLKVGLNDQLIQVDAPEGGQKVTVLIEDSTFTYKVEISKMENRSLEDQLKSISNVGSKKKKFSSSWFGSGEVGFNTLAFADVDGNPTESIFNGLTDSIHMKAENYTYRSFASTGKYWGAYVGFTIRDRQKASKRIENLYLKRKSHVRLDFNTAEGEEHFITYHGTGNYRVDSVVSGVSREKRVSFTNFQVSQLFAYGYTFNEEKDITLEYGVNLGLQFTLSETNNDRSTYTGTENISNNLSFFDDYVANPFIRVQHHAAFNYDRYSLNAKLTALPKRFGNFNQKNVTANILSLGVGYKF